MAIENDVYKLKGIGPKYCQMLKKIGVESIKELRHANAASLMKTIETQHGPVVGLSVARVQGWIDQAKGWDPDPALPAETPAASKDVAAAAPTPGLPAINQAVVRAMFEAWAASDESRLNELVAADVVFRIAGEEPYVGRNAALERWDRQDELLEDADYEAELKDLSATDDHVFTYVETWGKLPGTGRSFNYTTVTVYRVRDGQIVEVRPHVHDLDAYDEFWSSLTRGPAAGVTAGGYSPTEPPGPVRHPGGFQRFRL